MSAVLFLEDVPAALEATLASLRWCDEILVFALDRTPQAALPAGVAEARHIRWFWVSHLPTARQQALQLAKHDWLLLVQADEIVSPALAEELAALRPELAYVYSVPLHTYFCQQRVTGDYAARQPRLFNRHVATWRETADGGALQVEHLQTRRLRQPIERRWINSAEELLVLSHLEARRAVRADAQASSVGRSSLRALVRSAGAFLHSYVWQRRAWQGHAGLLLSVARAQTTFWTHALQREASLAAGDDPATDPCDR